MNQRMTFRKQLARFLQEKKKESGIENGHYEKQAERILGKNKK